MSFRCIFPSDDNNDEYQSHYIRGVEGRGGGGAQQILCISYIKCEGGEEAHGKCY